MEGCAYKKWEKSEIQDDLVEYNHAKKETKREVTKARKKDFEEWCECLDIPDGRNKVFRKGKLIIKDRKDAVREECRVEIL